MEEERLAEEAERLRLEEAEKQRLAEEEEQNRLAEEQRLAEEARLEEERKEAERIAAEQEEAARQEELAEQKRQTDAANAVAAQEQQARRARLLRRKAQLTQEYKQSIRKAVTRKFRPPSGLRPGATCTVRARLVFPNEIVDVQVEECTGGREMARAVEKAVLATNPFPMPPHKAVFERVLVFDFKPGG